MKSVIISLLLTIWTLPVPGKTAGLSTNMTNFVTVYNGYYDNRAQYEKNKTANDYIQLRSLSVTTLVFSDRLVIFDEWSCNGVVIDMVLITPYEDNDGVIHLPLYNFTDPSQYRPGEYKVENLSKLTPQDLQPSTREAEFEPDSTGLYVGIWPVTNQYIKGKPDLYTCVLTCDIIVAVRFRQRDVSAVPYNLIRQGDKFPVTNLPDGFVSPCL